jgi:ATP-dependent RNA helicase SUPV3L1/SUV3
VAQGVEAAGGIAQRLPLRVPVDALSPEERRRLRAGGLTIGALDLFNSRLLKPEGARWRRLLLALRDEMLPVPPEGATVLPRDAPAAMPAAGFRPLGLQAVRLDLVERIARAAHDARKGRAPFAPDPAMARSMGVEPTTLDRLMVELGFRGLAEADGSGATPRYVWRGRPPARPVPPTIRPGNAFGELAELIGLA